MRRAALCRSLCEAFANPDVGSEEPDLEECSLSTKTTSAEWLIQKRAFVAVRAVQLIISSGHTTISSSRPAIQTMRCSCAIRHSCQSGAWSPIGKDCQSWSGDLNWLEGIAGQSGCVNGAGLGNAPTGDWFFIKYVRHYNPSVFYVSQSAIGMTGEAAGRAWTRSQQSGSGGTGWSAWVETTTSKQFDTKSLTRTGYQSFPGGLVIQWGESCAVNGYVWFYFPKPFSSGVFQVVVNENAASSWSSTNHTVFGVDYRDQNVVLVRAYAWTGGTYVETPYACFGWIATGT